MPASLPPLTSLAQLNQRIDERRFTSVKQLYANWLNTEVPTEVAEQLLAYAIEFQLDCSEEATDVYPVLRSGDQAWIIMVHWSGIERICRRTGLWMPGRSTISELTQNQVFITGSCHLRYSTDSDAWVEVSEVARLATHFNRDFTKDDPKKAEPIGDWALIPELKLSEIAQYLAAAKALGDVVTRHETAMKYPPIQVHYDAMNARRRFAASAR